MIDSTGNARGARLSGPERADCFVIAVFCVLKSRSTVNVSWSFENSRVLGKQSWRGPGVRPET